MDLASAFNIITSVVVTLGGSSVVVFGLSGLLGKIWANRLMENEKNAFIKQLEDIKLSHNKELSKLNNELQLRINSSEQFHQISQKTYEKLFEEKIKAYTTLMNAKTEYLRILHEDEEFELHDYPSQVYYDFFQKVRNILNQNRLYISNELSVIYDTLYFKIAPILREAGLLDVYGNMNNDHWESIEDNKEKQYSKMIDNTSDEMKSLLDQIDSDVKLIRKKIDIGDS